MEETKTTETIDKSEKTRKLASIQKIVDIRPIEGADRIVTAQILGWECVVKKDEFSVGDLVVYFETDSILPEKPEFEFLRERKFRIKIIKLKKQISQGLVMPLSILPKDTKVKEGDDVSTVLGVTKHDPQLKEENELSAGNDKSRSPIVRFLMNNFSAFRWLYLKLNSHYKGNFPSWIAKTDECRIQVCAKLLMEHFDEPWYITEKLDGCLHEDTLVETKDGNKTIKEICEKRDPSWIKSYNLDTKEIEWQKINGFSNLENDNGWYELTTESGETLKLTGVHLVFLPELECYRKVSELNGDEKILLKKKE